MFRASILPRAHRLAAAAIAIVIAACSADSSVTPAAPSAPEAPAPAAVALPGVTVIADTAILAGSVVPKGNIPLPLLPDSVPNSVTTWPPAGSADALPHAGRTANLLGVPIFIQLSAEIAPPTVQGQVLQATHIVQNGSWVYVAYAMIGAPTLGAVDAIQMSNGTPRLVSRATFTSTEYYAVDTDGSRLYLAGASADTGLAERAVLDVITLNGGALPSPLRAVRLPLPSYAGTGVSVDASSVWVTSGSGGPNTGGLSVYAKSNLALVNRFPFLDARGVHSKGNYVAVMAGTPGTARVFSATTRGQLGGPVAIGGATVPESKGVAWVDGAFAYFAAGDGGLKVAGLSTTGGAVRGAGLPIPNVLGVPASVSTTNAVFVDGVSDIVGWLGLRFMFAANGEAGVQAYVSDHQQLVSTQIPSLGALGRIGFGTTISANFVAGGSGTLFVAAGLGGVKVLTY
jgi:hypothetical protein